VPEGDRLVLTGLIGLCLVVRLADVIIGGDEDLVNDDDAIGKPEGDIRRFGLLFMPTLGLPPGGTYSFWLGCCTPPCVGLRIELIGEAASNPMLSCSSIISLRDADPTLRSTRSIHPASRGFLPDPEIDELNPSPDSGYCNEYDGDWS